MTAADPPALYIGYDRTMTVVSTLPLRAEGGATTYRWGCVAEVVPSGERVAGFTTARKLLALGVLLFLMSAGTALLGTAWALLLAAAGTVVIGIAGSRERWESRPAAILAPEFDRQPEQHCLLSGEERNALWAAVDVGKRISRTLPALAGMIDTYTAERLLANALFDLAKVLTRRQDLRELAAELAQQRHDGLPADSPAVRKLRTQQERVTQALSELDADVGRRIAELEATAVAGENFLREREIGQVTSRVDETLASLAPAEVRGAPDSGVELAGEVEAVLAAYRELNDRYGG